MGDRLTPPPQGRMTSSVSSAVALPGASRHLFAPMAMMTPW
ncbi:hypothetical protein [Streptosporangium sp. 'caverna']|nr:hypothetical protein [Streptosporangium sp. 'caverna']